jgi:lipoprotein NlpI
MIQQFPEDSELPLWQLLAELLSNDKKSAAQTATATLQKANELERTNRDRKLCQRYLGNFIRAILLKDKATAEEAKKRLENLEPNLDSNYKSLVSKYLDAVTSGDETRTDVAWHQVENLEQETEEEFKRMLFVAALGQVMANSESMTAEETARRFLETNDEFVPYIAMLLYARTSGPAREEAKQVIQERWRKFDRAHWKQRLQGGDETAWREMLIGYYLQELKREQIFSELEDEQAYSKSDLRAVPVPRQGLLCEAYFYDALLAEVEGDQTRRDSDLHKVVSTRVSSYIEYDLAKFLLESSNR